MWQVVALDADFVFGPDKNLLNVFRQLLNGNYIFFVRIEGKHINYGLTPGGDQRACKSQKQRDLFFHCRTVLVVAVLQADYCSECINRSNLLWHRVNGDGSRRIRLFCLRRISSWAL